MFDPRTPIGYTRLKTAVLLIALAFVVFAGKSLRTDSSLSLTLEPASVLPGQTFAATVKGPAGTPGDIYAVEEGNPEPRYLGSFALSSLGVDQVSLQPTGIGTIDIYAQHREGKSRSRVVQLLVQPGLSVPGTSIFVLAPRPGASVEHQAYVRGRALPGTSVHVRSRKNGGSSVEADSKGEWGKMLDLTTGSETIYVGPSGGAAPIEIRVSVH